MMPPKSGKGKVRENPYKPLTKRIKTLEFETRHKRFKSLYIKNLKEISQPPRFDSPHLVSKIDMK